MLPSRRCAVIHACHMTGRPTPQSYPPADHMIQRGRATQPYGHHRGPSPRGADWNVTARNTHDLEEQEETQTLECKRSAMQCNGSEEEHVEAQHQRPQITPYERSHHHHIDVITPCPARGPHATAPSSSSSSTHAPARASPPQRPRMPCATVNRWRELVGAVGAGQTVELLVAEDRGAPERFVLELRPGNLP